MSGGDAVWSKFYYDGIADRTSSINTKLNVYFFFNDTATTEIYTRSIVGSVRFV